MMSGRDDQDSESAAGPVSERARVTQHAERARYGLHDALAVFDAGVVAHVGVVRDGTPIVIPMAYGRIGETLYLHGGNASRLVGAVGQRLDACVTVTLLDGLVLARSAFKHSMNYRSVVAFGQGRAVSDADEVLAGLQAVTDHNLPGRWASLRAPTRRELAATSVVAFPLQECTVKVREGGPLDAPEDLDQPVWAGVVPLRLTPGVPAVASTIAVPEPVLRADLI